MARLPHHSPEPTHPTAEGDALGRLGAEISAAKKAAAPETARVPEGMELGMRMVFDLIGGVSIGGFVGWQLDRWLGTQPWLMILCILLGLAAGITAMVRLSQRYG